MQYLGTVIQFSFLFGTTCDQAAIMLRKDRIDSPGACHHIICRGIERGKIFKDDIDRNNFVDRLASIF